MKPKFKLALLLQPQFRAAHVLVIGLVLLAAILIRIQPHLIIHNESSQVIAKLDVFFQRQSEAENHHVNFKNIPAGGTRWQSFDSKWGQQDSIRIINFHGTFANGQSIEDSDMLAENSLPGERLNIIAHSQGTIEIDSN